MKLYIVTFECVEDMECYPIVPQAYKTKESAVNALKNAYEQASAEYPEDYERICSSEECDIYEDGRYSENRWVGRVDEVEVED